MIDVRATFPDWFTDYDPSYPNWEDLYGDPYAPGSDGSELADAMVAETGDRSWAARAGSLDRLIDRCRVTYQSANLDWLARNAPMGSRWRPQERLSRNHAGQRDGPDWGEFKGLGWDRAEPWPDIYDADHMKPLAASGERRRKDGVIQHNLGDFRQRPIGTAAFRSSYHLAKRWWSEQFGNGSPFRCNFEECTILPAGYDGPKPTDPVGRKKYNFDRAWVRVVDNTDLNPAARLWTALCGKIDFLLESGPTVSADLPFWQGIADAVGLEVESDAQFNNLERNRLIRVCALIANDHRHHPQTD